MRYLIAVALAVITLALLAWAGSGPTQCQQEIAAAVKAWQDQGAVLYAGHLPIACRGVPKATLEAWVAQDINAGR